MERSFFDHVRDVFEGIVTDLDGGLHTTAHRRGLKVWYGDAVREHYEAQLIRHEGAIALEVGFHAEYPEAEANVAVMTQLLAAEATWRAALGEEPVAGAFIGSDRWRRISEVWEEAPEPDDVDATIEVAARLADYVLAIEPLRRTG